MDSYDKRVDELLKTTCYIIDFLLGQVPRAFGVYINFGIL